MAGPPWSPPGNVNTSDRHAVPLVIAGVIFSPPVTFGQPDCSLALLALDVPDGTVARRTANQESTCLVHSWIRPSIA